MSLDVSLISDQKVKRQAGSGIFIRENGKTLQVTDQEWRRRHPGRVPVRIVQQPNDQTNVVYRDNITHNLGKMAAEAGIYYALWHPEKIRAERAKDISPLLAAGLRELMAEPDRFKALNPENEWGDYDGLVQFVTDYLAACREHPEAEVEVSR